jgi:hypothetical protein
MDRRSTNKIETDLVAFCEQADPKLYPHVHSHARDLVGGGAEARFELGLELLVGGLDKFVTKA